MNRFITALFLLGMLALGGCLPAEADFSWGLGTTEVVGTVEPAAAEQGYADVIIVVFERRYLLETMENGQRIYTTTAHLGYVGSTGVFTISMPSEVVGLDMLFIAPDHLTREFHFNRQIGIGQVRYRAVLPAHNDWHSHFYTYLQPILSDLIVEKRYRLSQSDQLHLGGWIQAQQARLEALRDQPADHPDS